MKSKLTKANKAKRLKVSPLTLGQPHSRPANAVLTSAITRRRGAWPTGPEAVRRSRSSVILHAREHVDEERHLARG